MSESASTTRHVAAEKAIIVRGARVHNLCDVDVDVPRDALVVLTGVSGSGKSSLAVDTLFAEGQRRYLESLSAYTRQFLDQLERPDVDLIAGLPPTISIGQSSGTVQPRSTLATTTQIYDYLRLLYARSGQAHCPHCGTPVSRQTSQQIVERILSLQEGRKVMILAPLVRGRKGLHRQVFEKVCREGFVRARVDGEVIDAGDPPELSRRKLHDVEAVVDRIVVKQGIRPRLQESVELALANGNGACLISFREDDQWRDRLYSERFACADCGRSFPELEPRTFSFSSPYGACPECDGLGVVIDKSTAGQPNQLSFDSAESEHVCAGCGGGRLNPFARAVTFAGMPIHEFTALPVQDALEQATRLAAQLDCGERTEGFPKIPGIGPDLTPEGRLVAERTLPEIVSRLEFLVKVGLDYVSLDRPTATLSGGEFGRARLAGCLGSGLAGVCYILDEPTVGLHPRDTGRLIRALQELRDRGNSLIVVEHDGEMMRRADYLIDLGPGAGIDGGRIVAAGPPKEFARSCDSPTARYLRDGAEVRTARKPRQVDPANSLRIEGAVLHNLRGIDVDIPLGRFVCATGVSGSGKSSLFVETLIPAVRQALAGKPFDGPFDRLIGVERIARIVEVDQRPIGRTGRSNPATYTGLWQEVRKLFARTREARLRGYTARRFSFNSREGRCDHCRGWGVDRLEMQFLPDMFVTCPDCKGDRFNRPTLAIRYAGKNVADVLRMRVDEAAAFFENVPKVRAQLETLSEVGLGYLSLGQSSLSLSGGEAQRVKLAAELTRTGEARTLFVLDEPTTGLHPKDVSRLIVLLHRLAEQGDSVLVIEHQLDVIAAADWVIDLGPDGGAAGGRLAAAGPPRNIANANDSHTGGALRAFLDRSD